jgi:hypothetical protein
MPFHLNYSGRAPITTYFRVKPAPLRDGSNDNALKLRISTETDIDTKKADTDTVATATTSELGDGNGMGVRMDVVDPSTPPPDNTAAQSKKPSQSGARYVAAFRGRTVHGVTVDLPEGYSGIVLRPEGDGNRKGKPTEGEGQEGASSKSKKGRPTRKASRIDVDEDVDMGVAEGHFGPVRTLKPTASFSSFILWNPDLPVDEARDEYRRSVDEWTRLATEASSSTFLLAVLC